MMLAKKTALAAAIASVFMSANSWADRSWSYTYNSQNLMETQDGPRTDVNDVTTYGYHDDGNLHTITNALSQVTTLENYNGAGLAQKIIDANGVVTLLEYNWRGQPVKRTVKSSQGDAITVFVYDKVGLLEQITLADGTFLHYEYDPARRLRSVTNRAGDKIVYEVDPMGNRTKVEIKDGAENLFNVQRQVFDELGRLIRSITAANHETRYGYDKNSNMTSVTDANNQQTVQGFDALNRLIKVTDAKLGVTQYEYDAQDNLIAVTDPRNLKTTYKYDYAGNMYEQNSPDTGLTVFTHDDAGNALTRTDARGVVTEYSYDALNRVTQIRYPANPAENISYSYDDTANGNKGVGRLTRISDQSGTISFHYDDRGNLVKETRALEGQTYVTLYAYDLANKLTDITYPSGRIVRYHYNEEGQIDRVATLANSGAAEKVVVENVSYLPFGPMQSLTYGNGLTRTMSYDQDYQLTGIDSSVMRRSYGYDPLGNITSITDQLDSAQSQSFGYDALSRLETADGGYGDIRYDYDAVGNRTARTRTQNGKTLSESYEYASDSNRLTRVDINDDGAVSERTFAYTDNGNIRQDQNNARNLELIYNQQNRLEEVKKGGEQLAMYVHNALGQRVIKVATDPAANVHFHYSQSGQLLAETKPSGEVIREMIYLNGVPVAMLAEGGGGATTPVSDIIVDNHDSGVTTVGAWSASSFSSVRHGADYQYAPAGSGGKSFTWKLPVSKAGVYKVYAYWNAGDSRASNATYSLQTSAGAQSITANQQQGGGWGLLGSYSLNSAAAITLSDNANGYVIADAIKLEWVGSTVTPDPAPLTVDNSDAAATQTGGWSVSSYSPARYGDNYHYAPSGTGSKVFTWNLAIERAGNYRVYAYWNDGSSRASNVKYDIQTQSGTQSVQVNQQQGGGSWSQIGVFPLDANAKVSVSDNANGYVIADAIKVEWAGE
ncbi:hypothetical protein O5O45_19225 [Hahella aquimaris]|uniref:golvesin C-terminal-like domain-containing protein n=1 Tax=Hahella sp. HNIBRBA332 TaxID=3015983 RepID=UPI00273ACEE2|nr:hypothetical protein [Hahella sp. HNIBRBA332]WLQ11864.1 hypothetical protein O5O45_19225 [Hahella sp. HNIBRBA332]